MAQNWRDILEELDVEPQATAGPGGADGDWFQLHAAFGTKSFVRLLTDGDDLAVECAPPGDVADVLRAFQGAWSVEGDAAPFVARRSFPEETDAMRDLWVRLAKMSDAVRDEDFDAVVDALAEPAEEESLASEPSKSDSTEASEAAAAHSETGESAPSGAAFESIGDDERAALDAGEFDWRTDIVKDTVHAILGFGVALDRDEYEALERRVIGNLRGKYDVDARVVSGADVSLRLRREPVTRLALHIEPDQVVGKATVREAQKWVGEYFETLASLASSGIDPLVFLGVQASRRAAPKKESSSSSSGSAFETIGEEPPTPEETADDSADEGATLFFVADDDDEQETDGGDAGVEVVFDSAIDPAPDDPLVAERYDDPRLKRSDASTALVDVVLRHPGYSDRSIGQVLSILLSIEYSTSLDISQRAPTVIAWGVARDRAHTMKTVIEGAGGRVLLVEPGTFGEE